jgi:hypothetical protein
MADDDVEASAPVDASRAASVATSMSAATVIVGFAGQAVIAESVVFPMLAGLGFAALAVIVLAHQL